MKFEVILPLLCFLLDPLRNRHCMAWNSMIKFCRPVKSEESCCKQGQGLIMIT